jgi:MFS family permease
LIASPCGVVIGYGMCAIMLENLGWRYAFYIQSLLLIPCLVGMLITPARYMDIDGVSQKIKLHEMDEFRKSS